MMALLDEYQMPSFEPDPELVKQARAMAAIRAGLGMLGGENIGRAAQGGFNTYFASQENARRNQMEQAQLMMERIRMQQAAMKEREMARRQQAAAELIGKLTPEQRAQYGITDEAYQALQATQDVGALQKYYEPRTTKEGDVVTVGTQPLITRAKNGQTPYIVGGVEVGSTPVVGYAEEQARQEGLKTAAQERAKAQTTVMEVKMPDGSKRQMTTAEFLSLQKPETPAAVATQGRQQIGVERPPEVAAQAEQVAKEYGTAFINLQKDRREAPTNIGKWELLGRYLSNVNTGKGTGSILALKGYARSFLPALTDSWTQDVPFGQAALALSREIALQMRNPQYGAGLPGNLSDQDRNFLETLVASSENDPMAVTMIIKARTEIEKRKIKIAELAEEYKKKNGGVFDSGFEAIATKYHEDHPLFAGWGLSADKGRTMQGSIGGQPAQAAKTPQRTGTYNGRKVIDYGNGWEYAP